MCFLQNLRLLAIALSAFSVTLAAHSAIAAPYTWSAGAGLWDLQSYNWLGPSSGSVPLPSLWVNGNDAIFGNGQPGLVSIVGSDVTATGLTFVTSGNTIDTAAGRRLVLSGSSVITVHGTNAFISAPVVGTNGVTKTGAGLLYMNGLNSYTGLTSITGGGIVVGSTAAIGSANP